MNINKTLRYSALCVWLGVLVLWPKASNVLNPEEDLRENPPGEGLYKPNQTKANFGLLGVRFYESNQNKKRWIINSEYAELHRKENYAFLEMVRAQFFAGKTGNIVFTNSDIGRSWTDKSLVELEGHVSIQSKSGYLFTMDKLNYNGTTHEFKTDDLVHMVGPDPEKPLMILKGVGMNADIDREHFILHKNVRAKKSLKNGNWMHVTSHGGEFFTDESRAVFIGNVHTVTPTTIIDSDVFEMTMSHEKDDLQARGSVVLKNKDRIGHAETAFLEVGGNEIILEGKARIDSKDSHIVGRRIHLYTDEDRVDVEEAEGTARQ